MRERERERVPGNDSESSETRAFETGREGEREGQRGTERFRDLSLCLLTVVRTRFWEAIRALRKLVEFRSPRHRITFVEGMSLLFSLPAAERRSGRTALSALLAARVLEIVILTRAEAYARFPREAGDCNLRSLCQATGFSASCSTPTV